MSDLVQNQIQFEHPLLLTIALTLMAGCDTDNNQIHIDFNAVAPIPDSVLKAFSGIETQRLVWWHVTENATDVEIDSDNLIIRFKTIHHHPKGVVEALHAQLPGCWVWKFASEIYGFDIGYYEATGSHRTFIDMSYASEPAIKQFTDELWLRHIHREGA